MSDAPDEQRKPPARGADDAPDNVLDGLFGSVPPVAPGTGSLPVTPVTDDPVASLFGSSDALPAPPIDDLPSEHELTRWSVTQGSSLFDEKVRDPAPAPAAPAPTPQAKPPAPPMAPPALKKPRMFETQLGVPPPPPAAGSVAAPLPKAPPEPAPKQVAPVPPSLARESAEITAAAPNLGLDSTMLALPATDLGRPPGGEPPDLALASEPAQAPLPRARAKPEPAPEPEAEPAEPKRLRFKPDPDEPEAEPPTKGKQVQKKGARRRNPPAKPSATAPAAPGAGPASPSALKRLVPLAVAVVVLGGFLAGVMSRSRGPDAAPAVAPRAAPVAAATAATAKPAPVAAAPAATAKPAPVAAAPAATAKPAPVAAAPTAPAAPPAAPKPAPVAAAPDQAAPPVKPAPVQPAAAPAPAPEPEGEAASGGNDTQTLIAAQKKLAEDDPNGALPLLEALLAKDPRDHHAAEAMAEAMLALERPADAVRYAREIVKRRPKRASYRLLLGDALLMAGDKPGAEAEWREALAADPDSAQAKRRLGQ